jgi:tRNA(Ile2) C34 agmatinyltransferase TiaS
MTTKIMCPECGKYEVSKGYGGLCRKCYGIFVKQTDDGMSSSQARYLRLKATGEMSVMKEM